MLAADALASVRVIGPFFVVEPWRADSGWRPLVDLTDPAVLTDRVHNARTVIAERAAIDIDAVEAGVAASIVFLGLAARLLAPALATVVLTGHLPETTIGELWWRPVPGGPWPVAAGSAGCRELPRLDTSRGRSGAAAALVDVVVAGAIAPILEVGQQTFGVAKRVMWGNVGSGLGGALGMLATARPDCAAVAAALSEQVLAREPLIATGELVQPDPTNARRFFVRQSCCGFYAIPGGGMCADCPKTPESLRREQWRAALTPAP